MHVEAHDSLVRCSAGAVGQSARSVVSIRTQQKTLLVVAEAVDSDDVLRIQ